MTTHRPLRIGLFGTGPWASGVHAPSLAAHPDVVFTGVWGRRPEAARDLAGRHGVRSYRSPAELIADVDAVAFAVPPGVQAGLAVEAAGAGRHLLLDKPVATDPADARAVAEAARKHDVASVVFLTLRFGAEESAWITEQARTGGWFTAHAEWLGSVFATDSDSPYADSPWRREKGALWDVGPHVLSILLPILGEITGLTARRGPGDTVLLTLRHTSGAAGTVALSLTAPPAAAGVSVTLRGTAGVTALPARSEGAERAYGRAIDALLKSVRTGTADPCDVGYGLRLTELLAAAEHSLADDGAPVTT